MLDTPRPAGGDEPPILPCRHGTPGDEYCQECDREAEARIPDFDDWKDEPDEQPDWHYE